MSDIPSVPNPDDEDVLELIQLHGLTGPAVHVPFSAFGYSARNCHISAKHRALTTGGRRVHGWALWRWDVPGAPPGSTIIFAEHHSVWEDSDGALVDVTPPHGSAAATLFVRDDTATIVGDGQDFLIRTDLTNWSELPRVFKGAPTADEFWRLSGADENAIAYAASLGFELARIVTEEERG